MSFRLTRRVPVALGVTLTLVLTVAPAFAAPSTPDPARHLKIPLTTSDGSLTPAALSGKTADDVAAKDLRRQEPDVSLQTAPAGEPATVGDATTATVLTDVIEAPNFVVAGLDWPAGQQFPSDAEVFLRVSERGHWSDWTPVQVEPQHEGGRFGTEPFISGNAEKVQVQVTGAADELPADLRLSIVTPGGPQKSLTTARANAAVAITATKEGNTGRALGIHPRSDWAGTAYQPPSAPTYTGIKAAVVHHTAGTNNYTQGEVPGILRGIAAYHMTSQGWNDVGYNFLVDKYGGMWEGRYGSLDAAATRMVQGAHALGYNTNTMGVSVLGTYGTVSPTEASFAALKTVISFRFDLAGLDARDRSGILDKTGANMLRIVGHRDVNSTDCPGQLLWNRLPALREQVGAPGTADSGDANAGNVASLATATASSAATGQAATNVVDGSILGYPQDSSKEWSSNGEKAGAWIKLDWGKNVTLTRIVLHDRPNLNDQILAGRLTFSDGTTVAVGALTNAGTGNTITLPTPKTTTSVRFDITQVSTTTENVGLAEMQAWGTTTSTPPSSTPPSSTPPSSTQPQAANIAPTATVTASSADTALKQYATNVIDGSTLGYPQDDTKEWSSAGEKAGAWIKLDWGKNVTLTKIVLYDRPNLNDQILAGRLTFSDGSTVAVSALTNAGTGNTITLATPKTTTSVRFDITQVSTTTENVGLAEMQAWGTTTSTPPSSTQPQAANIAPTATVTASSADTALKQYATNVIDGSTLGYPQDDTKEWSSAGEKAGAWIKLDWGKNVNLTRIVLYDRPNLNDQILAGRLTFSDGSTVAVGALTNAGTGHTITLATPKTTTSVRFDITQVSTATENVGLSEFQAYSG